MHNFIPSAIQADGNMMLPSRAGRETTTARYLERLSTESSDLSNATSGCTESSYQPDIACLDSAQWSICHPRQRQELSPVPASNKLQKLAVPKECAQWVFTAPKVGANAKDKLMGVEYVLALSSFASPTALLPNLLGELAKARYRPLNIYIYVYLSNLECYLFMT